MKRHMKKVLIILCVASLLCTMLAMVACDTKDGDTKTLATPQNVQIDQTGRITWGFVTNAQSYVVVINGAEFETVSTSYQVASIVNNFTYSVYAKGEGFENSEPSQAQTFTGTGVLPPQTPSVVVTISGENALKSGESLMLSATVVGAEDKSVTWSIVEGASWASIAQSGKVTAELLRPDSSETITVRATSNADASAFADKQIVISADPIAVAITSKDTLKSGMTQKVEAVVTGASDKSVSWSIVEGDEWADVDAQGNVTTIEITPGTTQSVTLKATSNEDGTKFAQKSFTIITPPALTQSMIDVLDNDYLSFDGDITIDLWTIGDLLVEHQGTYKSSCKTAFNGTDWYAEYENGNTGGISKLYYKNNAGIANQVVLSYNNDEELIPLIDETNQIVSWQDAGMYNSFKNLTVADFTFDKESWMWVYDGDDGDLMAKIVASITPYDMIAKQIGLTIDDGEILEIVVVAEDDYRIYTGYNAKQVLRALVNYGEDVVEVPTIEVFTHDPVLNRYYETLQTAIDNMKALESYKMNYVISARSQTGTTISGYSEIVTQDICYFEPIVNYTQAGPVTSPSGSYGFKAMGADKYNSFYNNGDGTFEATRAYATSIENAKPSFDFSAEIFRRIETETEQNGGRSFYYVDSAMCGVATMLYYGMGNDYQLYGMFAGEGMWSTGETFTPFVVVKDGYIQGACFYFNLGSMFGTVEIEYSDFNTATIENEAQITFEERQLPTDWSQFVINKPSDDDEEDVEYNALEYFKIMLGDDTLTDETVKEYVPFFGEVLGDTFGFAMTLLHTPQGMSKALESIVFYYDVPLDADYTLNSQMRGIGAFLLENGFTKNQFGEYNKGNVWLQPSDSGLDFTIYMWLTDNA